MWKSFDFIDYISLTHRGESDRVTSNVKEHACNCVSNTTWWLKAKPPALDRTYGFCLGAETSAFCCFRFHEELWTSPLVGWPLEQSWQYCTLFTHKNGHARTHKVCHISYIILTLLHSRDNFISQLKCMTQIIFNSLKSITRPLSFLELSISLLLALLPTPLFSLCVCFSALVYLCFLHERWKLLIGFSGI